MIETMCSIAYKGIIEEKPIVSNFHTAIVFGDKTVFVSTLNTTNNNNDEVYPSIGLSNASKMKNKEGKFEITKDNDIPEVVMIFKNLESFLIVEKHFKRIKKILKAQQENINK